VEDDETRSSLTGPAAAGCVNEQRTTILGASCEGDPIRAANLVGPPEYLLSEKIFVAVNRPVVREQDVT